MCVCVCVCCGYVILSVHLSLMFQTKSEATAICGRDCVSSSKITAVGFQRFLVVKIKKQNNQFKLNKPLICF